MAAVHAATITDRPKAAWLAAAALLALVEQLAEDLRLDALRFADLAQGIGRRWRRPPRMQAADLATRVRHAASFPEGNVRTGFVVTCKGISLHLAAQQDQMGLQMLAVAIGRISKPYRWSRSIPSGDHSDIGSGLPSSCANRTEVRNGVAHPDNGTLSRPAR